MNYRFSKISICIIFCICFLSCSTYQTEADKFIIVKIPPLYNPSLSKEENYWRFRHFLFPQESIPNPIPDGLPHDDSLLVVSLEKDERLTLNSEVNGSLENTDILEQRLKDIFQQRAENVVFEVKSNEIVKAVVIKAPLSTKYRNVVKITEVVKRSGAHPIVLLIDELPK